MTRRWMVGGGLAALGLPLVLTGNALLWGYIVAVASLGLVAGLIIWTGLDELRRSNFVLRRLSGRGSGRRIAGSEPGEERRAA